MSDAPVPPPPAAPDPKLLETLNANVLRLAQRLEETNMAEYVDLLQRPWKLMWTNFLAGLGRGVGLFVGGGIMGAITLGLLSWLIYHLLAVAEMIPVINQLSHAMADVVKQFLQQHPAKK